MFINLGNVLKLLKLYYYTTPKNIRQPCYKLLLTFVIISVSGGVVLVFMLPWLIIFNSTSIKLVDVQMYTKGHMQRYNTS